MTPAASEALLDEISRWKLEAKEEDNSRYFYPRPEIRSLELGENCYVIGRKGSGKTAIAEYIKGSSSHDVFVRTLSFKNFPFNELYKLEDDGYTRPSQYTTLWKYIIYSAVCDMMASNHAIDADVSSDLRTHFDIDLERALSRSIAVLTEQSAGLSLLQVGGNSSQKKTFIENDTPWQRRVEILERLIEEYVDGSNYYILFDELDEDYKDVLNIDKTSLYFELLTGLFKAAYDVRGRFKGSVKIRPIVFLRDDIYDIMKDNDKNKWDDLSVDLSWSEGMLQRLLAFRISRAGDQGADILSFSEAFSAIFESETVRVGTRSRDRRTTFKFILARTLMRPRDVVSYVRECAKFACENELAAVPAEGVKRAEKSYSRRFRQEMVDEIQSIVPYIDDVFDLFSTIRKPILSLPEFEREYGKLRPQIKGPMSFNSLCKILFHFSVIGNQPAQHSAKVFKYENGAAKLNVSERICLHLGLWKALQIT